MLTAISNNARKKSLDGLQEEGNRVVLSKYHAYYSSAFIEIVQNVSRSSKAL